jgi:hypothetical protein
LQMYERSQRLPSWGCVTDTVEIEANDG